MRAEEERKVKGRVLMSVMVGTAGSRVWKVWSHDEIQPLKATLTTCDDVQQLHGRAGLVCVCVAGGGGGGVSHLINIRRY